MRAIAERVFASETKDESVRDEISMFDVPEDCPILQTEMAHHLHTDDDKEKRWAAGRVVMWRQQFTGFGLNWVPVRKKKYN